MDRLRYLWIGLLLLLFISFPYVRGYFEESMVGTMLIQYPLLVGGGYFLAKGFPRKWRNFFLYYNENGIAGMIITICVIGFWILPRSIDAALNEPVMEIAKYSSLSFVAGSLLYYSWQLLGPISKGFIWANLISMIFVMSWLYTVSPARLCNNYLLTAQQQLGKSMFILGMVICLLIMVRVFIGKPVALKVKKRNQPLIQLKSTRSDSSSTIPTFK
ncbi:hypothetical protein E1I69_15810 [Bacillus timonensis]|uniref:Uncharacterized protein n=1 Tax=Bacillus timonensis TaxID=1033734 RepID=A0A4S3PNQ2_9BACI|nr:hypothetical protein [Bacillus timonensis]THE11211.1 hypothetical protein E1I69_15810 [Bacillus timonensis]